MEARQPHAANEFPGPGYAPFSALDDFMGEPMGQGDSLQNHFGRCEYTGKRNRVSRKF